MKNFQKTRQSLKIWKSAISFPRISRFRQHPFWKWAHFNTLSKGWRGYWESQVMSRLWAWVFHSAGPELPISNPLRSSELTQESGMFSNFSHHRSVNFWSIPSPSQISSSSENNAITLYLITSVTGKIFTVGPVRSCGCFRSMGSTLFPCKLATVFLFLGPDIANEYFIYCFNMTLYMPIS